MSTFANRLVFKKNLSFVRLFNRYINDKRTGKAEVTFSNGYAYCFLFGFSDHTDSISLNP